MSEPRIDFKQDMYYHKLLHFEAISKMTIAKKTMLIMLVMILILLAANTAIQRFVIFPAFQSLEHQQAKKDVDRVEAIIFNALDLLNRHSNDWSYWNDTYVFMQDLNEDYIESNLSADTFSNIQINLAYFIDTNLQPVWAESYHFGDHIVNIATDEYITQSILLLKDELDKVKSMSTEENRGSYGLFFQNNTPILFSISPILTNDGEGPVRGYVVFGRTLDPLLIKQLGNQISTAFEIVTATKNPITMTDFSNYSYSREALNKETLKISKTYSFNNTPAFTISSDLSRSLTRNGLNSLRYALFSEFIIGIILIIIIGYFLNKIVFYPLAKLKVQIQRISRNKSYTLEFNKMLDILEKNNSSLVDANIQTQSANTKLKKLSLTDPLTGIANRLGLEEKLYIEWGALSRQKSSLAILMVDIDHFKLFNDYYGHLEGDKCIKILAEIFNNNMQRPRDMAARFGGEEFILILPETTINAAYNIAKRIHRDVANYAIEHKNSEVSEYVTISTGIACTIPAPGSSIDALIKSADEALYTAKKNGRNKIEIRKPTNKI